MYIKSQDIVLAFYFLTGNPARPRGSAGRTSFDYLIFYNTKRVHFAFQNKLSPVQFMIQAQEQKQFILNMPQECKSGWDYTLY